MMKSDHFLLLVNAFSLLHAVGAFVVVSKAPSSSVTHATTSVISLRAATIDEKDIGSAIAETAPTVELLEAWTREYYAVAKKGMGGEEDSEEATKKAFTVLQGLYT